MTALSLFIHSSVKNQVAAVVLGSKQKKTTSDVLLGQKGNSYECYPNKSVQNVY